MEEGAVAEPKRLEAYVFFVSALFSPRVPVRWHIYSWQILMENNGQRTRAFSRRSRGFYKSITVWEAPGSDADSSLADH